ncbi:MAG TPA: rhodanese-like domain-containing protein [Acidimicrobiales bacterium]|nr:rhodanese-like domain-containing protein [Acidimicrobiales bacterium]
MGLFRRSTKAVDGGVGPLAANDLVIDGAVLLDVRERQEWDAGHASKARHLPLSLLPRQLNQLPKDRRIVVVCRSGNRSARAASLLAHSGFDALNLEGGMQAWAAAGLPVIDKAGRAGRVA